MEHRKFLFISQGALTGDIAWQVSNEGHVVRTRTTTGCIPVGGYSREV